VADRLRVYAAAVALFALAACQEVALAPPPPPEPEPAVPAPTPPAPVPAEPSVLSRDLETFYTRVEANLKAQGLLRTDGGLQDAAYGPEDLVRNFEKIALFEEYANVGGRIVARETESRLHRWEQPVLVELEFGPRTPAAKVNRDRVSVAALSARLARVTGHPVRIVRGGGNFHVFVVTEDDRRQLGPRLRSIIPGISQGALDTVIDMPRSTYCLVFAWDPNDDGAYEKAVAVIRAEHPDLLRLSCLHEEMAQGMGLSNDSPEARPSVFNDDEEFALLTPHDEAVLRILYDSRLRAGMSASEAMPIVREIVGSFPGGAM
jgi:hypothetical protein